MHFAGAGTVNTVNDKKHEYTLSGAETDNTWGELKHNGGKLNQAAPEKKCAEMEKHITDVTCARAMGNNLLTVGWQGRRRS